MVSHIETAEVVFEIAGGRPWHKVVGEVCSGETVVPGPRGPTMDRVDERETSQLLVRGSSGSEY